MTPGETQQRWNTPERISSLLDQLSKFVDRFNARSISYLILPIYLVSIELRVFVSQNHYAHRQRQRQRWTNNDNWWFINIWGNKDSVWHILLQAQLGLSILAIMYVVSSVWIYYVPVESQTETANRWLIQFPAIKLSDMMFEYNMKARYDKHFSLLQKWIIIAAVQVTVKSKVLEN